MTMPLGLGLRWGSPSTSTAPSSGCSKPAMMFISVLLPQPEGPTMATNSPSATVKLTSDTTGRGPCAEAKPLLTRCTAILRSADIAPPHDLELLEQAGGGIEQQADGADDDHAGHDQVVAVARVA